MMMKTLKHYSMRQYLFHDDEKHFKFRNECLKFYVKCVVYLRNHLPFKVSIIKYAQFLQPEKMIYLQQLMQLPILPWRLRQLLKVVWVMCLRYMVFCQRKKLLTEFEPVDVYQVRAFLEGIIWRSRKLKRKLQSRSPIGALEQCGLHLKSSVGCVHKHIITGRKFTKNASKMVLKSIVSCFRE